MNAPFRKRLPHDIPLWVDPTKTYYFITICCRRRRKNHLAYAIVANNIFETIKHRNVEGIWYAHLALVMPDHVHLLLSFPQREKRVQAVVSKWKEWTAKTLKIEWQRDFFEHRLRQEESFREKADYILANPVRAGFIEAGDFIYIKPGVPHEVFNMSDTEPVVAFVARSSAAEWDNIIPYDRNEQT